jgi:uncharacterized Tic20 family protein
MSDEISEGAPKPVAPSLRAREEIAEGEPTQRDPSPRYSASRNGDSDPDLRLMLPVVSTEDRLFAIFSHLGGYITWIFAPVILLLVQKDRRSFGAWHAREAINFNICLVIYLLLPTPLFLLGFIDAWLILVAAFVFFGILLVGAVYQLTVVIIACIQAYRGVRFRYPLTIRFFPHPEAISYSDDHADLD